MDNLSDNMSFLLYLQVHLPFSSCFKKEKVAFAGGGGVLLFFINLPTSIVQLGLEDQEAHTIPQLLFYFTFVKKKAELQAFEPRPNRGPEWWVHLGGVLTPGLQAKGSGLHLADASNQDSLTDRAHSTGLLEVKTKGVLTFLTFWDFCRPSVACGERRGRLMVWFRVFNAGSCFELSLEVSLCQYPVSPSGWDPCRPQQLHLLVLCLLAMAFLPCGVQGLRAWDPYLCSGSDVPSLFGQLQLHVILPHSCLFSFFTIATGSLCFVGPNNYTFVFSSFTVPFTVTFKCPFGQT